MGQAMLSSAAIINTPWNLMAESTKAVPVLHTEPAEGSGTPGHRVVKSPLRAAGLAAPSRPVPVCLLCKVGRG